MRVKIILVLIVVATSFATQGSYAATTSSYTAEIWVDNWFALYINGKKIAEDSTPFNTERSFNSQKVKFQASYPFTVGVIARDYVATDSGLEYIGTNKQQIGDGGFVMQIRDDKSGQVIAGTDHSWKALVTFKSPLNIECATSISPDKDCQFSKISTPSNWSSPNFNDSKWRNASEFTQEAVGVKEGFFDISWSKSATLIWSSDLKLDNTILFRKKILKPQITVTPSIRIAGLSNQSALPKKYTCDGESISPEVTWEGFPATANYFVLVMSTPAGPPRNGEVATDTHFEWILGEISGRIKTIPEGGSAIIGKLGKNFQGRNIYAAPCSQGPGIKQYTFTLYGLQRNIQVTDSTDEYLSQVKREAVATASVTLNYARS